MKKLITPKMAPAAKKVIKMKNASLIPLSITMLFDGEYRRFFNTVDENLEKLLTVSRVESQEIDWHGVMI